MFAGHIVVAVFAEDDNPTLGLRYPETEGNPFIVVKSDPCQEPGDASQSLKHSLQ